MKPAVALAVLLVAAACVVSSTEAWGSRRRGSSSDRGRWSSRKNSTVSSNRTVIGVRKVDEEHPYFRSFSFNRNSSNSSSSLADLKQSLSQFFNESRNITWLVKNDRLLITRDVDVRMLKFRDQLEVWFVNSTAPSRAKTYYAFSKEARRSKWGGKDKKEKKDKKKDKKDKKDRKEKRRPRPESEEAEVEDLDMDNTWF